MSEHLQFMTVAEAAELARTSASTVRQWIRDGRLKAAKPGRRVLIERVVLLALLRGRRGVPPTTEDNREHR